MDNHKTFTKGLLIAAALLTSTLVSKAQLEIPDAIKDNITQGIAAFEAAKTPADIDKALSQFNEAAQKAPNYPDVHYYLGKTYAMLQGNAGRAVKELKRYLELYPDAEDKAAINKEIDRLNQEIEFKRKSNLVGIELMTLSDGIYIRKAPVLVPGGRLTSRGFGLKAGDKLLKVKDTPVKGMTLDEVFRLIDQDTVSRAMQITVERGGTSYGAIFERYFKTSIKGIRELGEEDLNDVVAGAQKPIAAVFWDLSDETCKPFIPVIRNLHYTYTNSLEIISVSVNENPIIASEFNIRQIPTVLMFKEGKLVDRIEVINPDDLKKDVEAWCK
jgi:thiol-disulfide isomerase/thioredoxin